MKEIFPVLPASEVLQLEGIANRDSLPYAETYALGPLDSLRTVVRGTIRFVDQPCDSAVCLLTVYPDTLDFPR